MNMRMATLACVLVALSAATTALGQTLERGEISGSVYDPDHAVVPRAHVTLTSPSTGFERTVPSDDSGSYVFTQDPAGEYEITAMAVTIRGLATEDVRLRILGDVAIIHARTSYTTASGEHRHGRYTDVWARRDGVWLAVSAHVTR